MARHSWLLTGIGAAVVLCLVLVAVAMQGRQHAPYGPYPSLATAAKKDIAMQLVSSAENSSLNWRAEYGYLEDIQDGRGYTGGIIGFTSGTHDMLEVVQNYSLAAPGNPLVGYIPALQAVDGSDSHDGLGTPFEAAWRLAAKDPAFQKAQDDERDRLYFTPALQQAKADGLRTLGQFMYYDALVVHGNGDDAQGFPAIRAAAMQNTQTPAEGGDEVRYLQAFLDARRVVMKQEAAHSDTSRIDSEQRVFLRAGNLGLNPPLQWKTYGDTYHILK